MASANACKKKKKKVALRHPGHVSNIVQYVGPTGSVSAWLALRFTVRFAAPRITTNANRVIVIASHCRIEVAGAHRSTSVHCTPGPMTEVIWSACGPFSTRTRWKASQHRSYSSVCPKYIMTYWSVQGLFRSRYRRVGYI